MRVFSTSRACSLLLGLYLAAALGSCSLAAYSETRSFRDALDGRSMDEAINGPVDKDTSTYGDRTGGSSSSPQASTSSPMMLNIPANGNLDDQQQHQDSELEREAGPANGFAQQQQPEEQPRDGRKQAARQSQRAQPSARQESGAKGARNAGQGSTSSTKSTGSGLDSTFGEEPASKGKQLGRASRPQSNAQGYGPATSAPASSEEQRRLADEEQAPAKSMAYGTSNDEGQQQVAAKQRATAAMLMSVNNGMKYSRNMPQRSTGYGSSQGSYGGSRMAQNMMASLANKAAYMQQSKAQQSRQQAPPVMMSMMQRNQQQGYSMGGSAQRSAPNADGYATATRTMGNLRRANQRKSEKKMSPSMVNAMLNKMVKQGGSQSAHPTASLYQTMGALMRSQAGAELLAKMMMPQMSMQTTPATRDQYKRTMMAAMMQQQQQGTKADEQQQQETDDSYDRSASPSVGGYQRNMDQGPAMMGTSTESPMAVMLTTMLSNGGDLVQQNEDTSTERPSYGSPQSRQYLSRGNPNMGNDNYGQQSDESDGMRYEPQQRDLSSGGSPAMGTKSAQSTRGSVNYQRPTGMVMMMGQAAGQRANSKGSNGKGRQQDNDGFGPSDGQDQQQQQEAYSTMMSSTPSSNMNDLADDNQQQQVMMNGARRGAPMNGFRQSYAEDEQQQQVGDKMAGDTKGAGNRPMDYSGGQMEQQRTGDEEQQRAEDGYGSAPMGMAEPFAFDYKIEDEMGNGQYRKEESDKNGVVRGSYGFMDTKGVYRHVEYVADERGFRANIKSNEPGLSGEPAGKTRSGKGPAEGNGTRQQSTNGLGGGRPDYGSSSGSDSAYEGQQQQAMSPASESDSQQQQQQQQEPELQ